MNSLVKTTSYHFRGQKCTNLLSLIKRSQHNDGMPVILYKYNVSPPARTVLITAEILGLRIETREINILEKKQLAPEYLEKNPIHTIPLLEDGDFVLADSHAIIIYMISKYGADKATILYPNDLEGRAIIHQRLFFNASILFPRLYNVVKDVIFGTEKSIGKNKVASIKEAYGFLEKYLERSRFVAGNNITIADIACVTTLSTLNIIVPVGDKYPKVQAWLEVLSKEQWYQKLNQPGLKDAKMLFAKFI